LHGARVRLNIRNLSKLAAKDVDGINRAVGLWRQAPVCAGNTKILMIEGVENVPLELKVL